MTHLKMLLYCKKVKESHVAQRVPGGLGSQISLHEVSLRHQPPLPPGMFLLLIFTRSWVDPRVLVRSEGNMSLKNPVTLPGIDPGTVRLVAQRLNHHATPAVLTHFAPVVDWPQLLYLGFLLPKRSGIGRPEIACRTFHRSQVSSQVILVNCCLRVWNWLAGERRCLKVWRVMFYFSHWQDFGHYSKKHVLNGFHCALTTCILRPVLGF